MGEEGDAIQLQEYLTLKSSHRERYVWLQRHGQAQHNLGYFPNLRDPILTEIGNHQIILARSNMEKLFQKWGFSGVHWENFFSHIYFSPLTRTTETVLNLLQGHTTFIESYLTANPSIDFRPHALLQEHHAGTMMCDTGVEPSKLEKRFRNDVQLFQSHLESEWFNPKLNLKQRTEAFKKSVIREIWKDSNENRDILLIAHHGVLRHMLGGIDAKNGIILRCSFDPKQARLYECIEINALFDKD